MEKPLYMYIWRSIPLSIETKEAWKAVSPNVFFFSRDTSQEAAIRKCTRYIQSFDVVLLNLGNFREGSFVPELPEHNVWNDAAWIEPLITPAATRALFDDLLPPQPVIYPTKAWIKPPGRGGNGKICEELDSKPTFPRTWDIQQHIDGQEYRVLTVKTLAVQGLARYGDNDNRQYKWVGTKNLPKEVRRLAKTAAAKLQGNCIVAWDIIQDGETGEAFLLEGNSCPGMTTVTATRVYKAIKRFYNERESEC